MSTGSVDLDQLADDHLDDVVDAAQWRQAEATYGEALAAALTRARQRRQVIAGLPRPAIDASLRDAILLGVALPKRKPIRFPVWAMGLGISAAAAALVLTVTLRGPDQVRAHEPTLARAERAATPAPSTAAAELRDAKRGAAAPMQGAAHLNDDARAFAALQEQAKAHVAADSGQARPAAEVPLPHVVELAWAATEPAEADRIMARRQRSLPAAPAKDEQTLAMDADTALREAAPASATLAAPAAMNAVEAEAGMAMAATAPAVLEVLLHNRTVTAWDLNADDIRIEALDADGQVIWRGRILAEGVVTVAAGSHARLRIDAAQWPAQAQSLRAVAAQIESRSLPLDTQ